MKEFALAHPWMTFWLVLILGYYLIVQPFHCWNRWLRSQNIRAQGWPPEHCDADGDFRELEDGV